jgi:hypothetical protein
MMNSYRATLKGNTLEWHSQVPSNKEAVEVSVVMLEPTQKQVQGQHMAQALQALADSKIFDELDAVTWQQEQRQDRVLPNRDQ